jgi:hypothetical protein
MRIGTDIVNVEMVTDDRVASQQNFKIFHILVRYKDNMDLCSKDIPTHAPHLSWQAKGIC